MNRARRVVVIGAGVAGLFAAYYLRRRELDVVVVDGEAVGSPRAASFANGGWICPAQAGPLPEPGLTSYGIRSLFDQDSALYFKPGHLLRLAPWLLHFRRYCNAPALAAGTAALAQLGRDVFDLVETMQGDGVVFDLYQQGMICAAGDERTATKALESLKPMRERGYEIPDSLLLGAELHDYEPALSDKVKAGFPIVEHWHVEPTSYVRGVATALRRGGVEIVERAAVTGFDAKDGRIRALETSEGEMGGDAFLLAAGSWTQPLAAKLGVHFPMEPGKGYSFFVRPSIMPRHGILFADIHAGASPFGDRLRLAGTMEFSGYNTRVDERRVNTVFRLARDYLSELEVGEPEEAWAGMRPIVADGLPVIDRARHYGNAYVATGYSMLGMTLAPPAGRAIAQFIASGERPPELEPFRLDRFPTTLLDRFARLAPTR